MTDRTGMTDRAGMTAITDYDDCKRSTFSCSHPYIHTHTSMTDVNDMIGMTDICDYAWITELQVHGRQNAGNQLEKKPIQSMYKLNGKCRPQQALTTLMGYAL